MRSLVYHSSIKKLFYYADIKALTDCIEFIVRIANDCEDTINKIEAINGSVEDYRQYLTDYRKEKSQYLNFKKVCGIADVSYATYQQYSVGRYVMPVKNLEKLVNVIKLLFVDTTVYILYAVVNQEGTTEFMDYKDALNYYNTIGEDDKRIVRKGYTIENGKEVLLGEITIL